MRLSLAMVLALAGCGASPPPHPRWTRQPTSALSEVPFPPPPARVEYMPKAPLANAVWIDGEWLWGGRRWAWRPGRWVLARPGASFSPWVTVRNGEGTLFLASGVWRDATGAEMAAPKTLAGGAASPGAVVAPEGQMEVTGPNVEDDQIEKKPEEKTQERKAADQKSTEKP